MEVIRLVLYLLVYTVFVFDGKSILLYSLLFTLNTCFILLMGITLYYYY